jgi:hypothetical protein
LFTRGTAGGSGAAVGEAAAAAFSGVAAGNWSVGSLDAKLL